jgi:cell division protein FtsQ
MLKRINWKAIFKGFAWLVCLAGVGVLMSFISQKKHTVKCSKVEILIPGANNFIEREEIDAILNQNEGNLVGRNLEAINIHEIEKTIKANPYIAFVKVYADMDGVISIEVKQRQPVLRIINAGGQDYYIDSEGLKMPMSPNFTANVLVATGHILEGFGGKVDTLITPLAKGLYQTALYAKNDTLWDAQFEQLFVNDKNDIEIIPRVGNQRIILGDANALDTKLNNLLLFYKQAMPKVGWHAYKTINLKYLNQIVCEKYDSLAVKKESLQPVMDSTAVRNKSVDSLVKSAIADEIKKATLAAEKEKVTPKPAPSKAKEGATKTEVKKTTEPIKTATSGDNKKGKTTTDKTDTKKNK